MSIEAIARRAEVSAQSVYAIFKSKTGILTELLDQSSFGVDYEDAVRQARSASDPETRFRLAARGARQIPRGQSPTFDLMRAARGVAPPLARLTHKHDPPPACIRQPGARFAPCVDAVDTNATARAVRGLAHEVDADERRRTAADAPGGTHRPTRSAAIATSRNTNSPCRPKQCMGRS